MSNRLLLLACSQRKKPAAGLLPALDRYDGPAFQVLRKFTRESPGQIPDILILSAKFGLIESTKLIPDYDLKMTLKLAKKLRPSVIATLDSALKKNSWKELGICLGKDYLAAVNGLQGILPESATVRFLQGGLGKRLSALHQWLLEEKAGEFNSITAQG